MAAYEGRRQVRYDLADPHLARALSELAQIVLAIDSDEPCLDDKAAAASTPAETGW